MGFCSYFEGRSSQFRKEECSKKEDPEALAQLLPGAGGPGGGCGTLPCRIAPPSGTFRNGGNMFRRRKMRSPGNQPSQVVLLRYPTPGGVVFPFLGKGLSPTGGKWNTARQGIFQTRLVWGREVPRREAPPVQPLGLRSDHVLNVCLRLSFHLQEAGKPEPPEASHLASPRPRSLGGPFLPPS